MESRMPIQIGKKQFYIGFIGVDRKAGVAVTSISPRPLEDGREERTKNFARGVGLIKKSHNDAV
jgi:hypothetical protein